MAKVWSDFDINSLALWKSADLSIKSSNGLEEEPGTSQTMVMIAEARGVRAKMRLLKALLGANTYTKGLRNIWMQHNKRRMRKRPGIIGDSEKSKVPSSSTIKK